MPLLFQVFHSDYFSGWVESELQRVLDNCENESEAASPNAFCSDWLTFRWEIKILDIALEGRRIGVKNHRFA